MPSSPTWLSLCPSRVSHATPAGVDLQRDELVFQIMNAITAYQFNGAPFSFHVGALPLAFEALLDRVLHVGVRPIGVIIGAHWPLLAERPRGPA